MKHRLSSVSRIAANVVSLISRQSRTVRNSIVEVFHFFREEIWAKIDIRVVTAREPSVSRLIHWFGTWRRIARRFAILEGIVTSDLKNVASDSSGMD